MSWHKESTASLDMQALYKSVCQPELLQAEIRRPSRCREQLSQNTALLHDQASHASSSPFGQWVQSGLSMTMGTHVPRPALRWAGTFDQRPSVQMLALWVPTSITANELYQQIHLQGRTLCQAGML